MVRADWRPPNTSTRKCSRASMPGDMVRPVATINGMQVLTNYDIFASAGGEFIATVQSFAVTADTM